MKLDDNQNFLKEKMFDFFCFGNMGVYCFLNCHVQTGGDALPSVHQAGEAHFVGGDRQRETCQTPRLHFWRANRVSTEARICSFARTRRWAFNVPSDSERPALDSNESMQGDYVALPVPPVEKLRSV